MSIFGEIDIRHLHRAHDDRLVVEEGRYPADHIPARVLWSCWLRTTCL
jgi:hypothetical protein